jgi:hypothetical protein
MSDLGGMVIATRIPPSETERVSAILADFPGVSPGRVFRALLLTSTKTRITNALSLHAVIQATGGRREKK